MSDLSLQPVNQSSAFERLMAHPLFSDGFRVFFQLAALSGLFFILYWGLSLSGVIDTGTSIDPFLLHRYDMIFGYLVAAMAGFLTTAVPSWSDTPKVAGWELFALGLLWIAGRLAFWFMTALPAWLVFGSHFVFLAALSLRILPQLWTARMRHLVWPVLLLVIAQAIAVYGYLAGEVWLPGGLAVSFDSGLAMAEGAFTIMVLTALAPISTVIVNRALDDRDDGIKFIPRPPIRRAAMVCIALYALARMSDASEALQGWLALASACAVLNILQDWHLRGALGSIYAKTLYSVYWFLAAGLVLQAGGLLGLLDGDAFVAGRHMMFIGGFSLPTLMVLIIAGTRHTGRELDMPWLFAMAILFMIVACLARSLLPLMMSQIDWMLWAWIAFALSFACYFIQFMPWALEENVDD